MRSVKIRKIFFTTLKNNFYSENTENENKHFIASIFLNISFIDIKINGNIGFKPRRIFAKY